MKTIFCNWKLNPATYKEACDLFDETKALASKYKNSQIIILPPVAFLYPLAKRYRGTRIEFGAQDVSVHQSGSHTGEVAAVHAKDAGAAYALVGHAETRARGVTDDVVRAKVNAALDAKLAVVVAVGEREQDAHGEYVQEVREQIALALADVPTTRYKDVTIVYEPIWAIGAPQAPQASAVHEMLLLVKKIVNDTFGEKALKNIRVAYGGAVDETTAHDILSIPGISGVVVGRASLHPQQLAAIMRAVQ